MPTNKTRTRAAASAAASASVVKAEFAPSIRDGSCGDELAARLKAHVAAADGTVDLAKLKALAVANGVWKSDYGNLIPASHGWRAAIACARSSAAAVKVKWGRGRRRANKEQAT